MAQREEGFATHLVEQALGERTLASATVLKLSGHWQQLTSLGSALHLCRSLTDVDLSRNGLTSLQGLKTLHQLCKLNLYYNAITDVSELARLRHHPELAVLDLRLNPVSPSQSSPYRCCHILCNAR
jgi:Leucine-rich repeat (LRR) protein